MRKLSTHIGVYAIVLIAVFYGSTSLPCLAGKAASATTVTLQNAVTSGEEKAQTASSNFHLPKDDSGKVGSVTLQPITVTYPTAGTEKHFFTHSAKHPYYINTL